MAVLKADPTAEQWAALMVASMASTMAAKKVGHSGRSSVDAMVDLKAGPKAASRADNLAALRADH
jgi:hypothetical protein